jgi:hypothetical protein
MDDLEKPFLVRNRRFLGIDWGCTRKCSSYNWCRIRTATFGNCQYPSGCDCNKFVWEGWTSTINNIILKNKHSFFIKLNPTKSFFSYSLSLHLTRINWIYRSQSLNIIDVRKNSFFNSIVTSLKNSKAVVDRTRSHYRHSLNDKKPSRMWK